MKSRKNHKKTNWFAFNSLALKSATMNIFRNFYFLFKSFVKVE